MLLVNYNTEFHILNLLADLHEQQNFSNFEVCIVNNVQNDAMKAALAAHQFSFCVKFLQSDENIGFGRAMNLASTCATGQHFVIINPDIRITNPLFLYHLHQRIKCALNYGIMTCQLLNNKGQDKSEFYDFEFHETFGFTDKIAWFSGAFIVIRQEVFEGLNGFDPDFFMYCEDEDLCLRIKKIGLSFIKLNDLYLYHEGGVSEPSKSYDFFCRWYRSQILFCYKHFSQEKFENLLQKLVIKSKKKVNYYRILARLPITRYKIKKNQWQAMLDTVLKTQREGINWLYFKSLTEQRK